MPSNPPAALPIVPGWTFGRLDRCCADTAAAVSDSPACSRRRRLWELGSHAHCPVIGVCLPLAAMRRLARKVLGGEPVADDYELHCGMVADCKLRTRMAEAVQRDLDRRFLLPLRRAAAAKTEADLAAWWDAQRASTDLPGALWATLTHPRCTSALEHQVLGQVHMIQHQVGMATRVELSRFESLIDENAVLARALANAQRRSAQQAREHAERSEALVSEVVRCRGQVMAAQSAAEMLREDLKALREGVPDLDERQALVERQLQQAERIAALQRSLHEARADIERLRGPRDSTLSHAPAPGAPTATQGEPESRPVGHGAEASALAQRAVLCVGGRTASVPVYRRLIESQGARFLHHDGGEEHSAGQLESTLAAADLVICQAGCVSHNAYWRVKDHCRRTGKRCIFVETPGATSLQRALTDIGSGA